MLTYIGSLDFSWLCGTFFSVSRISKSLDHLSFIYLFVTVCCHHRCGGAILVSTDSQCVTVDLRVPIMSLIPSFRWISILPTCSCY